MSDKINLDTVDFEAGKNAVPVEFVAPKENDEPTGGKWALRDRLRSRVLWASLIGCLITIFSVLGVWEKIGISSEQFSEVIGAVGGVLAAFGIFNDPTERGAF